ncbi:hypothetical protein SGO26_29295 (plasmid) [Cupriavidus metallidurans]|uniref:hypothetical protein n=1 Tax=Cupriavidus metallidurans TaxID=119219 RepID=UPI003D727F9B
MVDTKTIELFRRDEMVFTVQELIKKALAAIGALFAGGHPIIVAYSGGKDSVREHEIRWMREHGN